MSNKSDRHRAIESIITSRPVGSQEELRVLLEAEGWRVTQGTLSRDLRELGIVRGHTSDGPRYLVPEMLGDDDKPSLDTLLPQLFASVDGVGELVVLRTRAGGAQPIAEGIDAEAWPETLGTLAGENTILIICRSPDARIAVTERLRRLAVAD